MLVMFANRVEAATAAPTSSRRLRAVVAGVVAASLGAVGVVAGSTPAQAEVPKPAKSRVQLLINSQNPADAEWQGYWSTYPTDVLVPTGTTNADLGCADTDSYEFAWTTASSDGSAESPVVADDNTTLAYDAFPWIGVGDMPDVFNPSNFDAIFGADGAGNSYLHNLFTAFSPRTKASWPKSAFAFGPAGVWGRDDAAIPFTDGERLSLVLYCSAGRDANGVPKVRSDGHGRAVTSWLHFVTESRMQTGTSPGGPFDYFTIVGDQKTPTVAASAAGVSRTAAALSASLTDDAGTTYTDASGSLQWYAGDAATDAAKLGDPVAVTAGVAAVKTVDLSGFAAGSAQDFVAVFTPDETSSATYVSSTSAALTLRVGADAVATSTALAVSGPLMVGDSQKLTATVAPKTAVGTVRFFDGSTLLASTPLVSGSAAVSVKLGVGKHGLRADFVPARAADFVASSGSASVTVTAKPVAKVASTIGVKVSPSKVVVKKTKAKLVITVSAKGVKPAGKVTVKIGKKTLTATVKAGKASLTLAKFTKTGKQKLTINYTGSTTVTSSAKTITIKVTKK